MLFARFDKTVRQNFLKINPIVWGPFLWVNPELCRRGQRPPGRARNSAKAEGIVLGIVLKIADTL